jgi:hypothetical protein
MKRALRGVVVGLLSVVALTSLTEAEMGQYRGAHSGADVMLEASTADGGGALALEYDFSVPVVLTLDVTVGDLARYSGIDPFFQILETDDPSESLYRIDDGTEVVFELVAIDPAIGVRINGVNLLAAGDTVVIGTMPDLHADPEWQFTLPVGEVDCRQLAFRLATTAAQYSSSETYTVTLTNDPARACAGAPTPTPTPSDTPSPQPSPGSSACGDADGSGAVTVSDGVNVLRGAAGLTSSCTQLAVCDVDGSGAMTVTDGVNVLRAAAGLSANLTCPAL